MIVKKYKIIAVASFFLFLSCSNNIKTEESYQILNLLIRDFEKTSILHPSFAPPPSGSYIYSKNDSLNQYIYFYKQYIKKKTIFIENEVLEIDETELNVIKDCKGINTKNEFIFNNKLKSIDYKYLSSKKNNVFTNKNIQNKEIDAYLSFSNIIFNKNHNKAVIIFSVKYSKLNGFTSIVYLEKEHYFWEIICEKNLTVS
ncbi:hypothetical protein [Polaribacter cellanae]|uniref:Lipoprotein n=1 Tax=Polaribacter cellanae TaxID=2818493 RepID=A0A975H5E8_9FLAO|nr:hypothetical protein [Polaribacter cellanae]QTE21317.1 hypothetical protein J3359_10800 [Polaribacter cellanae]